ncbi:MAG: cell envelope integrity protein CreD [Acidobacteriota bacterium]
MKRALLFLKLLVIGALTLVILIALWKVSDVVSDRQTYRDQAVTSIASSFASQQKILGPVLVQPYRLTTTQELKDDNGHISTAHNSTEGTYTVFPHTLSVTGNLKPSTRRHGLYKVTVYELDAHLTGHFDVPPSPIKGDVQYGIPYLAFTVKDARGIVGTPSVQVNGAPSTIVGATQTTTEHDNGISPAVAWGSNLRALLPNAANKPGPIDVSLDLALNGTGQLDLIPLADSNHFELKSPWTEPLFSGQFLPHDHTLDPNGFNATWDVSSLASATQHQLTTGAENVDVVSVSLVNGLDPYALASRAVKYGILFVLLTFAGFFLFELVKLMLIHPVQYLLVGFCLAVFFLLLVSFSEHMPFGLAYLIASVACIGLLTYYLVFVLRSRAYGLSFGAILSTLYAAIYGLLISEDNALLLGSLLLFGLIALVMILTRRVNWYDKAANLAQSSEPPPPPNGRTSSSFFTP